MVDYQNGKIYKITSSQTDDVYYGSTARTLKQRWRGHKCMIKKNYEDAKIELVELFPCSCERELLIRERYYIENNKCINERLPSRTGKEWRNDNIELLKIKSKIYCENTKDKRKEYLQNNKDIINIKAKEWRENNKEKLKINKTRYDENNKEYVANYKYWRRTSPIGILARSYF